MHVNNIKTLMKGGMEKYIKTKGNNTWTLKLNYGV